MEQLLNDWEEAVLEIAPELKGEDSLVLRDHARGMLNFISRDIITHQTRNEAVNKALGESKSPASGAGGKHGTERLRHGLSVNQLTQELRALRARVTLAWGNEQGGLTTKDIDELVRFNEAIDQLIAASITSFSALKEQETRLIETMLNTSVDPAAIFKPDCTFLYLNTAMADLTNETNRSIVGKTAGELGLDFAEDLYDEITLTVSSGKSRHREVRHCFPSGREMFLECHFVPVFDDQNEVEAVVNTAWDITERKQKEYSTWQNANFDELTGIPNRRLFFDRLEQTLLEAQRKESSFALLFIDLDRFKQANDQLGHEAGDQLLTLVAERLSSRVRAMDTVARLGGDEFTVILKETDKSGAIQTGRALISSLEQSFDVDSHKVYISGSIGLTLFPDDGKTIAQLMHNADQAMYAAKKHGRNQVQLYEQWMAESESDHTRLNRELDIALRENQLEVYYQPIVDTRTGAISRAEALLRWNHPSKGLLIPSDFLSTTDQHGMTDIISAFVLDQAVTCSHKWRDQHNEAFPININESPASFVTLGHVDKWEGFLDRVGLENSLITMELTPESVRTISAFGYKPIKNPGLADCRLHLAFNDFGVETFSLSDLQDFGMESIKIDRDLIKQAGQGGDVDELLKSIIAMAHAINVQVVGVGVEEVEQLQFLMSVGCDFAQGFLFSEPLSQRDFEGLLTRHRQIDSS